MGGIRMIGSDSSSENKISRLGKVASDGRLIGVLVGFGYDL